jgi:hypothetical protein
MSAFRGAVTTIVASATQSASGNSGALNLPALLGGGADGVQFILNVTASSSPTTLDVYLQHSPNQGTTWYDFAHFVQVGAVSTAIQSLSWARRSQALVTANTGVITTGDAALAAGIVINGPIVDNYFRAKWVIVGTSYTFSLVAIQDRD